MMTSYVAEGLARQVSESYALSARRHGMREVKPERAPRRFPRLSFHRSHAPVAGAPVAH